MELEFLVTGLHFADSGAFACPSATVRVFPAQRLTGGLTPFIELCIPLTAICPSGSDAQAVAALALQTARSVLSEAGMAALLQAGLDHERAEELRSSERMDQGVSQALQPPPV